MVRLDSSLITRLRHRDGDAFREYHQWCFSFAYNQLGNVTDAEDVAQQTLINVLCHIGEYNPEKGALSTWTGRIVYRECLDKLKERKRKGFSLRERITIDPKTTTSEDVYEREEEMKFLRKCIPELPNGYPAVIDIRYLKEQSIATTAKQLGKPEGTIKQEAHRALKQLREKFERTGYVN